VAAEITGFVDRAAAAADPPESQPASNPRHLHPRTRATTTEPNALQRPPAPLTCGYIEAPGRPFVRDFGQVTPWGRKADTVGVAVRLAGAHTGPVPPSGACAPAVARGQHTDRSRAAGGRAARPGERSGGITRPAARPATGSLATRGPACAAGRPRPGRPDRRRHRCHGRGHCGCHCGRHGGRGGGTRAIPRR